MVFRCDVCFCWFVQFQDLSGSLWIFSTDFYGSISGFSERMEENFEGLFTIFEDF